MSGTSQQLAQVGTFSKNYEYAEAKKVDMLPKKKKKNHKKKV